MIYGHAQLQQNWHYYVQDAAFLSESVLDIVPSIILWILCQIIIMISNKLFSPRAAYIAIFQF